MSERDPRIDPIPGNDALFIETNRAADVARAQMLFAPITTLPLILGRFRQVARDHGYALAEHGSKARDLDLIACPWTDDALSAEELVAALGSIDGVTLKTIGSRLQTFPVAKPHGRLGWVFLFDRNHRDQPKYIDLSVMPRAK